MESNDATATTDKDVAANAKCIMVPFRKETGGYECAADIRILQGTIDLRRCTAVSDRLLLSSCYSRRHPVSGAEEGPTPDLAGSIGTPEVEAYGSVVAPQRRRRV
jgi:hypothetical protein